MKKMILDVVMSVIFVLLMKIFFVGILLHELLGLFIYALFILHKVFNWNWIKGVTKNLFSNKTPVKTKVMYAIDVVLFVQVTFIIVSGILISQKILTSIQGNDLRFWSDWHHFASYCALILISIHIGLHWQSIMNMFKKLLKIQGINTVRTIIARILAVTIMLLGVKSLLRHDISKNFTAPFKSDENGIENAEISDTTLTGTYTSKTYLSAVTEIVDDAPTLEEFLGKLICRGCSKQCPLTALQCSRGIAYKNAAIEEYNAMYTVEVADTEKTESTTSPENEVNDEINQSDKTDNSEGVENHENGKKSSRKFKNRNLEEQATPVDFIFIMGLFIAGTHYVLKIPKKLNKPQHPPSNK